MANKEKCENCKWWADFKPRVFACISTGHSSMARNMIELRMCKYVASPSCTMEVREVYMDSEYVCSCHAPKEK